MASKKINVKKEDRIKDIVEGLMSEEADDLTLIIPNQSKLVESELNFKAIKKLGEATGKKIVVESVDDNAVKLAKAVDLEANNPFFATSKPRSWQEIEAELLANKNSWAEESGGEEESQPTPTPTIDVPMGEGYLVPPRRRRWVGGLRALGRRWLMLAVLAILVLGGSWFSLNVLPRAEIKITTQKSDWNFEDTVVAKVDGILPVTILTQKKNAQMVFPAAGKKLIKKKAGGKIKVYNAYSSEPQSLVATTRFVTEDGKVFRLASQVNVPGAKIVDSKIEPSYIEAEVIADQPGEGYNIGPVAKFTIPGFQGTPKYVGFYGSSDTPMKGGFSGEQAYPTDADIKNAKARITSVLEEALGAQLATELPAGFHTDENSKKFTLLKFETETDVNSRGEFTVFGEAELSLIGFKEDDALAFLENKMKESVGEDYTFHDYKISYEKAAADFNKKELTVPIKLAALVKRPIKADELYQKVVGKSEKELKSIIFSLPGLANASVSLWPFYVGSIPDVREKVTITVD